MSRIDLSALFLHSLALWFVAVGGPSTILPEFHRYIVEANHWMTSTDFAELYTLAQAAPGPNFMYVTLMGWQLAGWAGAVTMTIPVLIPATSLSLLISHLNQRYPNAVLGGIIKRALTPITIGLMCASSTILMRAVNHNWRTYLLTLVTVTFVMRTAWNPLWLLAVGALAGVLGFV
jgi:chromate transporter